MLGDHALTKPELTGRWEQRLNSIERGSDDHDAFHDDVEQFTRDIVEWFADKERADLRVERRVLAPCPTPGCEGQIVEYPKSYGCNSYKGKDDPGCGYTLWKTQNGKTLTLDEALAHIHKGESSKDLVVEREIIGPCPTPGCGGDIIERIQELRMHQLEEPDRDRMRLRHLEEGARARPKSTSRPPGRWSPAARPTRPRLRPRSRSGPARPRAAAGQIVENSRAYGCTSWKSRKNPGCGFVIWKKERGQEPITREQAIERLGEAHAAAGTPLSPTHGPTEAAVGA